MSTLSPSQAAAIASGVYLLRESTVAELQAMQEPIGCEGLFSVGNNSRFVGRSGAGPWKTLSGFGYIANGEGPFAGEVLIATRGTAQTLDWLSNFNIGLQRGPGGCPVHAGFHEIWKSFRQDILAFLRGRNPGRIHCVGHSLGGALASLNADHISASGIAPVSLYTFGAPRSGDLFFSRSLTRRVGAAQIYRVAASSDPVPMIPLFPFCHLPFNVGCYAIASSGVINKGAHNMRSSYIPGMRNQTWATLRDTVAADNEIKVRSWLEQAAEGRGSVLMGSASALSMIGRALRWLLERARDLLAGAVGVTLAVGATVLDHLAWLLATGARVSAEMGRHVKALISAIFRFLGRGTAAAGDIGTAFLRWVLGLLVTSVRAVAERALASLN